jgi:toxin ParE1/3/4
MAKVNAKAALSARAKTDLLGIGSYSVERWGEAQAAQYLDELEQCTKMLAANPALGRQCDWVRRGLHRFETGRHVVFYRQKPNGTFFVRILHRNMLPDRQLREEQTEES